MQQAQIPTALKDSLSKIQTFVSYLENVWYDEAVIFIPLQKLF